MKQKRDKNMTSIGTLSFFSGHSDFDTTNTCLRLYFPGAYTVNTGIRDMDVVMATQHDILPGGQWKPPHCQAKQKVRRVAKLLYMSLIWCI